MKKVLIVLLVALSFTGIAQNKAERQLIERTYLLSHTVFGTKDGAVLDDLLAKKLSYGHSGGKIENRMEAYNGITGNTSSYSDTAVSNIHLTIEDDVAVVRHLFKAKEHKADGTTVPLNFSMVLVWVREKRKWRLMGRQAVRLT